MRKNKKYRHLKYRKYRARSEYDAPCIPDFMLHEHPTNPDMCAYQGHRGCQVNDHSRWGFIEEFVTHRFRVRKPGVDPHTPFKKGNYDIRTSTTRRFKQKVRVKCPLCGRKLWAWKAYDHDGIDPPAYTVPPHKKKGWWKKKKKG